MDIQYYGKSEKGKRDNNEDAFLAENLGDFWLFAVADGLGGHQAGEQASAMAVKILRDEVEKGIADPKTSLETIAVLIHDTITSASAADTKLYGMATTLVAVLINKEGKMWVMNIGDSRAYLIGDTIRHTRDQSFLEMLIESGEIGRDEALHHPLQTVLLQALGDPESTIVPDFYESDIQNNTLLLSTDGLHDNIKKETIGMIIRNHGSDLSSACNTLIEKALQCGSMDNITVLIAQKTNLPSNQIARIQYNEKGMQQLITQFLNDVMKEEAALQAGVSRHARSNSRRAPLNGYPSKSFKTRYRELSLLKPQLRELPFETKVFKEFSRTEQALVNAIIESYLQGVSTRNVENVILHLDVTQISASYVSNVALELDVKVTEFIERTIDSHIPYLYVVASLL